MGTFQSETLHTLCTHQFRNAYSIIGLKQSHLRDPGKLELTHLAGPLISPQRTNSGNENNKSIMLLIMSFRADQFYMQDRNSADSFCSVDKRVTGDCF